MTLREPIPFLPAEPENIERVLELPTPAESHACRRRGLLETRIASQGRVIQAAREVVAAVFSSGTRLSDAEAEAFESLIAALQGIPPSADA